MKPPMKGARGEVPRIWDGMLGWIYPCPGDEEGLSWDEIGVRISMKDG
jgi:hypothetical protein